MQILARALPFVGQEVEETIFLDGTAKRGAESVAKQECGFVGEAGRDFGVLVEPIVSGSERRPVIPVGGTMNVVRAALGDESDLTSGGSAGIGGGVAGGDAEFLQGIESGA